MSDFVLLFDGSVACGSTIGLVGVVVGTSPRGRWRALGPFRGSGDHGRVAERSAGWWWGRWRRLSAARNRQRVEFVKRGEEFGRPRPCVL